MAKQRKKKSNPRNQIQKMTPVPQKKKSIFSGLLLFGALLLAIGVVSCMYFLLLHLDKTVWMANIPLFQIMTLIAGALITAMFSLTLVKTMKYEKLDENGEILPISAENAEKYQKLKKYIKILAFSFIVAIVPVTMDVIITFFLS